jgi:hypothetical protein
MASVIALLGTFLEDFQTWDYFPQTAKVSEVTLKIILYVNGSVRILVGLGHYCGVRCYTQGGRDTLPQDSHNAQMRNLLAENYH